MNAEKGENSLNQDLQDYMQRLKQLLRATIQVSSLEVFGQTLDA